MRKFLIFASAAALVALLAWWRITQPQSRVVSPVLADAPVATMSPPDRPPVARAAPGKVTSPLHAPSVAGQTAPRPAQLFGERGPPTLTDVPAGRLRDDLARLPPAIRARALASLARRQVPLADADSLHVDATGEFFYACDLAPRSTGADPGTDSATGPQTGRETLAIFSVAVPVITPPVRHSKPGSANVIYLDFNGHIVTGTVWNTGSGAAAAYDCVPYDTDGNTGSFSPAEQSSIVRIWDRVAEDYRTFDVDVTTEAPATYTNTTAHVLITRSKDANGIANPSSASAGGIAYLGVFGQSNYASTYNIAFVYANSSDDGWVATTCSHETGHNMGLSHDGDLYADGTKKDEYYAGHGSGPTSWSPIMGSGPGNIQQWSKGEYFRANNTQDDLAIIAAKLSLRADDHANTDPLATTLIVNGPAVRQRGIISSAADTDRFSFTTAAGLVTLSVVANSYALLENKGALDVAAELYDATGSLLFSADPSDSTTATLGATLAAGTYYLRVHNAGSGTPLADQPTGYTTYGSVGEYTITGTIAPTAGTVAASVVRQPDSASVFPGNQAVFAIVAQGNPATSYQWQRSTDSGANWQDLANDATHSGATSATLTISAVATPMNGYRYRCTVSNTAGSTASSAATLTVQIPPPPVLPAFFGTGIPVPSFSRGLPAGTSQNLSVSISAGSEPITYQWRLNGTDIPGANGLYYFVRNWQEANAGVYTVVATNPLGSVTSNSYTQYISPEGGWQWRNPLPTGNGLTRAAYLNGRFLIGGLRGTLLVSTDGINWETHTVPASNNIYGFHYVNGLYVALASLGAVFTSPDTVIWTSRNTGTLHQDSSSGLQSVAYSGARLMAVGINGIITTSTDGINWTPGSTLTGDDLNGVAFGLGKFYAVSATNGRVYSSTDGAVWTSVQTTASSLRGIVFGAGRLVAIGPAGVITTSTDGLNWTAVTSGTVNALLGIDYVNNRFVIAGTNGTILTSDTGLSWTPANSGGNLSSLQNTAYGNGLYVTPGQSTTAGRSLLTSTDGANWSERIAGAGAVTRNLHAVAASADTSLIIAVGTSGTILQSSNGTTWTQRASATANQLNDINYGNGLFVAAGLSGAVISSTNGTNWNLTTITNVNLNGVKYDNTLWVAVGANGTTGRIYTSATGTTGWTQRYATGASLNQSAYANGLYVAVGDSGAIVTSATGTSWSTAFSGTTANLLDVTNANGLFVAVGVGVVLTSPDGLAWTNRTFTPDTLNSVIYAAGHYIATGPLSTYYVSPDGFNWTGRFTGSFDPMNDLALFNNQVFAVGDNSCILSSGAPVLGTAPALAATGEASVTLAATSIASPVLVTYQWRRNGQNIPGADRPVLTLAHPAPADAGSYTLVATNTLGTVESAPTALTVASVARVMNLSVRSTAGAGTQTLIAGFVVSGAGNKNLLLRGMGPALLPFAVANAVADPALHLYNGAPVELVANDDWGGSPALIASFNAVGAFVPASTISKDAALSTALAAGSYTFHIVSNTGTPGIALAELYDADATEVPAKVVNISARTQVGTGENILIAGFVITGNTSRTLLIRGVGPTLAANYGITDALADPQLQLYNGTTLVNANDNWGGAQLLKDAFAATGAVALASDSSKDAALLVTLPPGVYSAQVSGVASTTGVALVEIYLVP